MSNFLSTASGLFAKKDQQNPNKSASTSVGSEAPPSMGQETQQKIAQVNERRMQRQQQARVGRTIGGTLGG